MPVKNSGFLPTETKFFLFHVAPATTGCWSKTLWASYLSSPRLCSPMAGLLGSQVFRPPLKLFKNRRACPWPLSLLLNLHRSLCHLLPTPKPAGSSWHCGKPWTAWEEGRVCQGCALGSWVGGWLSVQAPLSPSVPNTLGPAISTLPTPHVGATLPWLANHSWARPCNCPSGLQPDHP